ncbi:MAG: hypothetical protein HY562_12150, partial [Ignavibacteriales bacterium]|nr:hypothetical protein [Ignavibacteriales bacterium]
EWCEANGVLFTGHLLFEEWLRMHARCEGNIFQHLKHMHIVGVDHLYPKIGTEKEPDQHVALKIASSAAHHFKSNRLLCESMGGTYWDCTLERMKWILNWEYVLGVNLFNNHGYHYSIEGERKRDWPPSQFYHHTWWKYYDRFTSYATRLSHLLSGGRHVAKVLVLYPLNSIWTNYVPQRRNPVGDLIESDFNYLTDTLLRLHYDFDYVDEDTLSGAKIGNKSIRIADESYSVLIIPPMTHMQKSAFAVVRRFIKSGGSVIADSLLPAELLDARRNGVAREVKSLFGADPVQLRADFEQGRKEKSSVFHRNTKGNIFVFRGKGLARNKQKEELRLALNACAAPDVTVSDEEVFYLHRVKDDFDIYFLANTSQTEKRNVRVTFENVGRPELWDPNTGICSPLHIYSVEKGRLSLELDFPPSESRVVVIGGKIASEQIASTNLSVLHSDGKSITGSFHGKQDVVARVISGKKERTVRAKAKKPLKPIVLSPSFSFATEGDNTLAIGSWRMTAEEKDGERKGFQAPDFDDGSWLSVSNGAWETQLPQERSNPVYPVELWYRTSFGIGTVPTNTRLLIDGFSCGSYQLYVNGRQVEEKGTRSKLDSEIKEVNIQSFIRPGRNVVAVQLIARKRTDGILDLLKIVGAFSLKKKNGGYVIESSRSKIKVGDWTEQGYPFFSGTGIYRTEVYVPSTYSGGRFFLEIDCGEDVLECSFNSETSLVVPWHPYRFEVTNHVRPGNNTVELRVTNTLINVLEGVKKPSGVFSRPRLIHEHVYTLPIRGTR